MMEQEPERYYDWVGWKLRKVIKNMKDKNKAPEYLSGKGKEDLVNSPPHYNQSSVECIDAIESATEDGFENYLQGNIIKYIWRYRYKNGIQDLKKAEWYLNKLINVVNKRYD